jgi:hypothetical protein
MVKGLKKWFNEWETYVIVFYEIFFKPVLHFAFLVVLFILRNNHNQLPLMSFFGLTYALTGNCQPVVLINQVPISLTKNPNKNN